MRYVTYDIDPFITARIPSAQKRETQITVEELKTIRDANLEHYNLNVTRDIFMLTYYLAGMNLVDILAYDFRTDEINYIRKDQKHQRGGLPDFLFHSRRSKAHYKKVYEKEYRKNHIREIQELYLLL